MSAEKTQNLQDVFLNHVRKNKVPVTIFLINGVKLQGVISSFDNFSPAAAPRRPCAAGLQARGLDRDAGDRRAALRADAAEEAATAELSRRLSRATRRAAAPTARGRWCCGRAGRARRADRTPDGQLDEAVGLGRGDRPRGRPAPRSCRCASASRRPCSAPARSQAIGERVAAERGRAGGGRRAAQPGAAAQPRARLEVPRSSTAPA